MVHSYRVTGILLATHAIEVFVRGLDVTDVAHDVLTVDATLEARDGSRAADDVAWMATHGYTSWRWREPPQVEQIDQEAVPLSD